jgi:geranylgeranyl pyrophosphate synthase
MCLQNPTRNESSISKVQDLIRKSGAIVAMQERCRTLFDEASQKLAGSHLAADEQNSIAQAIAWVRQSVRTA